MSARVVNRLTGHVKRWKRMASTAAKPRVELGTISPFRDVPAHIERPPYVGGMPPPNMPPQQRHTPETEAAMRKAGAVSAKVLAFAGSLVEPGITTDEIDALSHEFACALDAYPSPLGYAGFPKSLCTSVNEVVCHGIPDSRPLEEGDIVSIDVSCFVDGHHGDNCRTFYVGDVSEETRELVEVTREATNDAVALCGPGVPYNEVGHCIQAICDKHGYAIVRNYTGHGVGAVFHTQPWVLHYASPDYGKMEAGTTFTIEPMICAGSNSNHTLHDDWTVVTDDGRWCAQFEHTVLIREDGAEVLTPYNDDLQ